MTYQETDSSEGRSLETMASDLLNHIRLSFPAPPFLLVFQPPSRKDCGQG